MALFLLSGGRLPGYLVSFDVEAFLRYFFSEWSYRKDVFADDEVKEYVKAFSVPGALRAGFNYYRASLREDEAQWARDANRQLDIPTLVLIGDTFGEPGSAHEVISVESWKPYSRNMKGRYIEKCGHFAHGIP